MSKADTISSRRVRHIRLGIIFGRSTFGVSIPEAHHLYNGQNLRLGQSAGKSSNGHITKRGNKYLRTILVQAANSIAIGKPNKLRFFFQRIKSKKGHKKAIVALARKLASIIHHLLSNNEKYSEEELKEKKLRLPKFVPVQDPDIDGMIGLLWGIATSDCVRTQFKIPPEPIQ